MKNHIANIIVVEGSSDSAFISSFINALFVETKGYVIPEEDIKFLNNPRNKLPVIVLTDSDDAGKQIRKEINNKLSNYINVEININKCDKHGKHGVAESTKEEVINTLKEYFANIEPRNEIKTTDLAEIGIGKQERDCLCKRMSLGICNNKTFLKRINYLGISKQDLKNELQKYGNK